jgi:hypothetical protein
MKNDQVNLMVQKFISYHENIDINGEKYTGDND